jgi:hypothetical protein
VHDNHYAHPLDLLVFLDMNSGRVLETQMQPSPPVIPQMNFNYLAPLVHQERGTRTGMPRSRAGSLFCPSWVSAYLAAILTNPHPLSLLQSGHAAICTSCFTLCGSLNENLPQ